MSQTWDLDAMDSPMKELLSDLCNHNDGGMFLDQEDWQRGAWAIPAMELRKLGIIEVDGEQADEVHISLSEDGEAWLKSLPEGALGK